MYLNNLRHVKYTDAQHLRCVIYTVLAKYLRNIKYIRGAFFV